MTETVPQTVLDEALMPDLSKNSFVFHYDNEDGANEKITVKLKPLYVMNQKRFARTIASFVDNVAYDLENNNWVSALADATRASEALPELIMILVENGLGAELSDRQRNYCTMQPLEMITVMRAFAEKNAEVCKPILGFFDAVWPRIKANATVATEKLKEKILATIETAEKKLEEPKPLG